MRFGSHKVPFRVVLAGVSLLGLGAAAVLPTVANDRALQTADPIVTSSVNKVEPGLPSQVDMPDPTQAGAPATPRQILPQAPQANMVAPVNPTQTVEPMQASMEAPMMDSPVPMEHSMATAQASQEGIMASVAGEAADAGGIVLALDHARVMRVVGDISTIIIGNPAIADASMPDLGTIVLTGKSYGETNMVMLDAEGNILSEQMLRVTVRGQSLVSVYRGVQRTTLSCSPTCEIRPTPGDNTETVAAGLEAFQARNQAALEAVRSE